MLHRFGSLAARIVDAAEARAAPQQPPLRASNPARCPTPLADRRETSAANSQRKEYAR